MVCIEKESGQLIEMQSRSTPGTLIKNAKSRGYNESEIEEKEVTYEEFEELEKALTRTPEKTYKDIIREEVLKMKKENVI